MKLMNLLMIGALAATAACSVTIPPCDPILQDCRGDRDISVRPPVDPVVVDPVDPVDPGNPGKPDHDKGHGNDDDGHDEDNPGKGGGGGPKKKKK